MKKNKEQYVELYLEYLLNSSVEIQINAFVKGFKVVCNSQAFELFSPNELQQIVCGSPHLDFQELEKGATYENGYSNDDPTIKYFWEVVHDFSLEDKKKLLFFYNRIRQSANWWTWKIGVCNNETWGRRIYVTFSTHLL